MAEEKKIRTDVNQVGEFGLIDRLTKAFTKTQKSTIFGIGDDAAVLDIGDEAMVVSTDILSEGIHFDLMYSPLKHLGYKSVVVNLSDIYAMNAFPKQITFSFAISNKYSVEALEEIYEGIKAACDYYNVDLIGGDTTSAMKGMFISVTALGTAAKERVVYRSGARVGDLICVSGDLGAAYLGLQILEREKQIFLSSPEVKPDLENQEYLLRRQLKPEAQRDIIEKCLKINLIPTAMIDISDGLASELHHICKCSGVGAIVEEAHIPIAYETESIAIKFNMDPITAALNGGEDYELLFTIDPEDADKVKSIGNVSIIGEVTEAGEGIQLHTKGGNIHEIQAQGWVHFEKGK